MAKQNLEKPAEKKPVKIMETILRDAHQSLIATRMPTEKMLPIIDTMDKVGYYSVECRWRRMRQSGGPRRWPSARRNRSAWQP